MHGKWLVILIAAVIYVGIAIWGVGQGYSIGTALCWPFGVLFLAGLGLAKLWTRK